MTERENALRMIRRTGDAQWVPVSFNYVQPGFPVPVGILDRPEGEAGEDWFGCTWNLDKTIGGYMEDPRMPFPVDDICQWRSLVKFPDYEQYDWTALAARQEKILDRENRLVRYMLESGPFERLHSLTGFQDALVYMYTEPEAFKELITAITDNRLRLIDKVARYYKPDMLCINDDLGSASGPLMSVDMYREFIKPSHKRLVEAVRGHGVIHVQHSCGMMQSFLDDYVDIGIQVVHQLQSMNDRARVAAAYKDKLSFEVALSTSSDLLTVTDEELRADVRATIDTFRPYKNFCLFPAVREPHKRAVVEDEALKYGRL